MDLTQICSFIKEEEGVFAVDIATTIKETVARRIALCSRFAEGLDLDSPIVLGEEEFSTAIDVLVGVATNSDQSLVQAGFSREVVTQWLGKKSVPPEFLRKPVLQILVPKALDEWVTRAVVHELQKFLESSWPNASPAKAEAPTSLQLEQRLDSFDSWQEELSVRVQNCIAKNNIYTLGDLLSIEEKMFRLMPHFGQKSLKEINDWLQKYFGVKIRSSGAQ